MKISLRLFLSLVLLFAYGSPRVDARSLPAPSRVIYKCEVGGKITYTDEPCLGAKRMDIEPSRGLDKFSGKQMTGADVRQEIHHEMMADAIRPLTGLDRKAYAVEVRRYKLSGNSKAECRALDHAIARSEAIEPTSSSETLPTVQRDLLVLRKRYQVLGC